MPIVSEKKFKELTHVDIPYDEEVENEVTRSLSELLISKAHMFFWDPATVYSRIFMETLDKALSIRPDLDYIPQTLLTFLIGVRRHDNAFQPYNENALYVTMNVHSAMFERNFRTGTYPIKSFENHLAHHFPEFYDIYVDGHKYYSDTFYDHNYMIFHNERDNIDLSESEKNLNSL